MRAILVPLALVVATVVFTQPSAAQPRFERGGDRRPNPPPPRGEPFERILDEDQRAELRESFGENRERLREIDEKLRAARRELEESIFSSKFDEGKVKKTIGSIAKLEGERQFLRAKAIARIRPTLRPEQIERFKELRSRREEMGRRFRPGPPPGGEFRPDPRRERRPSRDEIAPRPRRDREFSEEKERRFESDDRRSSERRERLERRPDRPPRRELDERRSRDFPEDRDDRVPPSRGRPEPE